MFVRPPTDVLDSASVLTNRASPLRSAGCEARSNISLTPYDRWGCHIPCPSTDAGEPVRLETDARPQRTPESLPTVWCRGHSPRPPQCSVVHHSLYENAALGSRPASVCRVPTNRIPPSAPCPSPHRQTAIPSRLRPTPHIGTGSPSTLQGGLPSLECAMYSAVVSQIAWRLVPLASGAHTKDDPVERLARVLSFASGGLGRIEFCDHRLDLLPEVIRDFPDRIKSVVLGYEPPFA